MGRGRNRKFTISKTAVRGDVMYFILEAAKKTLKITPRAPSI